MKKAMAFGITLMATILGTSSAMAYTELNCQDIYRGSKTVLVISKHPVSGYTLKMLGSKIRGASNEGKLGFLVGSTLIAETTVKAFTDHEVGKEYNVRTEIENYTHLKCVATKTDFRDR